MELKNIPSHARRLALLTQANSTEAQTSAQWLADKLVPPFDAALIASLQPEPLIRRVVEPVAGIILAAGEASRFGAPKQLLDYQGEPFVRRVARTALAAGLSPVVVVTGANAAPIEAALAGLNVHIARNDDWQSGQSSSIRIGLQALPRNIAACLFLLADQPQVTPAVIHALMDKHQQSLSPVIAPQVGGQRANPVLFDRLTFPALMSLSGDVGGRAIFPQFPPAYLPWQDGSLLVDIDTPADLKKLEGLK